MQRPKGAGGPFKRLLLEWGSSQGCITKVRSNSNVSVVSAGTLISFPRVNSCVTAPPPAPASAPIPAPFPPPKTAPNRAPTPAPPPAYSAVRRLAPRPLLLLSVTEEVSTRYCSPCTSTEHRSSTNSGLCTAPPLRTLLTTSFAVVPAGIATLPELP